MGSINLSINPAILSHELRTPLTAILGLAEELCQQKLTKKQRTYLKNICQQGERLFAAFNQLLFEQYKTVDNKGNDCAINEVKAIVKKLNNAAKINSELSVLVIEDEPLIQRIHKIMLEKLGYRVDVAKDGAQALALYNNKTAPYAAILTDISMPGMSGIEVSSAIRRLETGTQSIPIIALTADITEETRQACLAAGINEVATKPIRSDALQTLFQRHLSANR